MKGKSSVLITGGSGLVGRYLTSALLSEGFSVSHLSRGKEQFGKVRVFRWDPEKGILDPKAFEGIDTIIHLAGANIGEKRWTDSRKEQIRASRVDSAKLIHKVLSETGFRISTFISASGISCYGTVTSEKIFDENDPPANDFLGNLCSEWEHAADQFASSGARTVKIRTAVALERNDSALEKIILPAKFGFLGMVGNGRQYMPWIHVRDLTRIYVKAVTDQSMVGVYNAVSPQHMTHREFMKTLSEVLGKPLLPVPVPAVALKAAYGEMAGIVLLGSRVSAEKIKNAGFTFEFGDLLSALKDIFTPKSPRGDF
ncbi:MAG TPA: TIGR01777 family oxidoreductase [Bacteroidales bacterium]|nr:TIGR01777 family oxidoreductase [Bacteroidales bacterium]